MDNVVAYAYICNKAGRAQDFMEFMTWTMLGIEPDWFKELTKEIK